MTVVVLFIQKKYKDCIKECQYTSEKLLTVKLKTENQMQNIVCVYNSEHGKHKREKQDVYCALQHANYSIPSMEAAIIIGNFYARTR